MPSDCISTNSSRLVPWGETGQSVPKATFTPAEIAARTESRWTSITALAFSIAHSGMRSPRSAARSTPLGAIRVGTNQVPRSRISSMVGSSR